MIGKPPSLHHFGEVFPPIQEKAFLDPASDDDEDDRYGDVPHPFKDELRHDGALIPGEGIVEAFVPVIQVDAHFDDAHGAADDNGKHDPGIPSLS